MTKYIQQRVFGKLVVTQMVKKLPVTYRDQSLTIHNKVKCRCDERQYNEMFTIAKLFLGPFPFPYLMCVRTIHFNEFRTFSITN